MASSTSDENGTGKESTGDTGLDEGRENNESVDNSEEGSEENVEEHAGEALSLPEVSKNVSKKENDVQIENPRDSEKFNDMEETRSKPDLGNIGKSVGLLLGTAILCVLVAVCFYRPPEREMKGDFDLVKVYGNGVDKLQLSFTNQTERFWKILKNRGLAHLRNNDPSQPLVFLLAAPPPAHEWVDCLATKLAEKLDPRHKRNLARINGADEKGYPADQTKKKMDVYLKNKFREDHRVAVIYHLELLPPPSPLLFYSYCDDQNAPHKHVAIIFTVHLPEEPSLSLSPKEAEATVEKYLLKEVWLRDDMDAVAALLSCIANSCSYEW
ncbi:torsin-1A-interacting protein 2-like isoform X2 [Orbicella faveolata]|uniref:torsin-1A-interacting protein 2-like isoform X2 n=1 Tax=Orbicella faveolata TaxID=48498 RepID=UPI0009E1CEA3|nr:torsin-1A-interacting protein 2-like isoform X2 [Orbicella faveolata]